MRRNVLGESYFCSAFFSDKIQLPSSFDVNQTLTFIIKIGFWVTFIFVLIVDIVFVEKFTSNLNKVIHIKSVLICFHISSDYH